MTDRPTYQFSSSLRSGHDFYTADDITKLGSANLSGSVTLTSSVIVISRAQSALSAEASLTSLAKLILVTSASLSGAVAFSPAGPVLLIKASIALLQNLNVTAKTVKFSSQTGVDTQVIRTVLLLDGKPLTNQTRSLQVTSNPIYVQNINWNGSSSRYYKDIVNADKKSFSLNWSFIPNYREKTVDLNHSRDYIRKISTDPDMHTLTIINQDENGTTPYTETVYNVFIKDFSENLIRRDLVDNCYYWSCALTLEEV